MSGGLVLVLGGEGDRASTEDKHQAPTPHCTTPCPYEAILLHFVITAIVSNERDTHTKGQRYGKHRTRFLAHKMELGAINTHRHSPHCWFVSLCHRAGAQTPPIRASQRQSGLLFSIGREHNVPSTCLPIGRTGR